MSHFTFEVRFVHAIAPSHRDVATKTFWRDLATLASDRKALAAALREEGVLGKGGRLRETRVDPETGNILAFPARSAGSWHCIVLREIREDSRYEVYVTSDVPADAADLQDRARRASASYLVPAWGPSYGSVRTPGLTDFLCGSALRPVCAVSAEKVLTFVDVTDCYVAEGYAPENARIAGGFFVASGEDSK